MTDRNAQPNISELDAVVNAFYAELDVTNSRAQKNMAAAYSRIIDSLLPKFDKALAEAAADPSNQNAAFKVQRFGSLLRQADEAWASYADLTTETLSDAQRRAVRAANQLSANTIQSKLVDGPATMAKSYDYLPKSAITEIVGMLSDGSPLNTLTNAIAGNMGRATRSLLLTGLATGVNPRVTSREIRKLFDAERHRIDTIVRTETLRAAREGARKNMLNNADVVKGWQWYSRRDKRTCAVCFAQHGTMYELKTKMATHPNCRCMMVPVTKTWEELGFRNIPNPENPAFTTSSADMLKNDPALCRSALGKGGCFAFQQGIIPLDKFVTDTYSPKWGYGRTTTPLSKIVSPADARSLTRGVVPPGLRPIPPKPPVNPLAATPKPLPISPTPTAQPPKLGAPAQNTAPVSNALVIQDAAKSKWGKDLHEAVAAIDRVHTDGLLRPIPVVNNSAKGYYGQYSWYPGSGKPGDIKMSKLGDHRKMTLWHEAGHFIDNQALNKRTGSITGYASSAVQAIQTPEWAAYHKAVEATKTVQNIRRGYNGNGRTHTLDDGSEEYISERYIKYILQPHEIFARAYSQYVAEESGETTELRQEQSKVRPGSAHATVWPTEDFAPIRAAITDIFRAEGWK